MKTKLRNTILAVMLVAIVLAALSFIASHIITQANIATSEPQRIVTKNLIIEKTDSELKITEVESGRVYTFTFKKIMVKRGEMIPAKVLVDNEALCVASLHGVTAIYDKLSGTLHLV